MRIGYASIFVEPHRINVQIAALLRARCDTLLFDDASAGVRGSCPALLYALNAMINGDELVI